MNRRSFPLTAGSLGLLSPRIGGLRHLLEDPPQRHTGGPMGNLCRSPLVRSGSAVTPIAQTALPAAQIPKYVDPLSTFFGARTSAATINVSLQEVQQAVLPAAIYTSLPAPFRQGTFVWGCQVGDNPPHYPGFTIEARRGTPTTVTYENPTQGPAMSGTVMSSMMKTTI